jgi:signal transduction histidine kinase
MVARTFLVLTHLSLGFHQPKLLKSIPAARQLRSVGQRELSPQTPSYSSSTITSPEIESICQAQFELLEELLCINSLRLYFPSDNETTGNNVMRFELMRGFPAYSTGFSTLPTSESDYEFVSQFQFVRIAVDDIAIERNRSVVETEWGGLLAPLVYGSSVIGMVLVDRLGKSLNAQSSNEQVYVRQHMQNWSPSEARAVEKVAATLAFATALDRKILVSDVAFQVQVGQMRTVVKDSLQQIRNPLTALRTFGKLLLRRLEKDKSVNPMNSELAADLLIQSDRLIDLLAPVNEICSGYPTKLVGPGCDAPEIFNLLPSPKDISKVAVKPDQRNPVDLEMFSLEEIVQPILSAAAVAAARDGVHLEVPSIGDNEEQSSPTVYCDSKCTQVRLEARSSSLLYVLTKRALYVSHVF